MPVASWIAGTACKTLDLVYPRSCVGCGVSMVQPGHICWDCLRESEKISRPFCETCGDPVDGLIEGTYECTWCRKNVPQFVSARSVFRHRGAVLGVVHELKYSGGVYLVGEMAEFMAGAVRSLFLKAAFDVVVGVPLFPRRERERGFNQGALLADAVAGRLSVESFNRVVERIRDTASQTALKSRERAVNVKGAFRVRHPDWLLSKHVLLVDDVMTTGATVAEISKVMMRAGAASVHVISFARG